MNYYLITTNIFFFHAQKGAVTKVVTVVKTKKGPHTHKKKGELMENDQDAMEVSCSHRPIKFVSVNEM